MTPAPANELLLPEDQTLGLLSECAKALNQDAFMVRIFRKKGIASSGLGENLAMFADATVEQISQPEPWIQRLAGGGEYTLQAAHMTATAKRIGGLIRFRIGGEPRPVNPTAVHDPAWEGPRYMTFPTPAGIQAPPQQAQPQQTQGQQGQRWGWGPETMAMPVGSFPIGFQQTQQAPGVAADDVFRREQAAMEKIQRAKDELAAREAALQKQLVEREEAVKRAELENRIRMEQERVRVEAAAHARALDEKLERLLMAPKADGGIDKTITAVAAVVTPILAQFMQASAAAREASERRAEAQNAQTQALIQSLLTKPTGLPPEVTMLFEMQKNQSAGNAEMMTRIVDAMGAVSKSSVQMIEVIADLNGGGPEESPAITMVREAVRGIAQLTSAAKDGARKQIAMQNQQTQRQQIPGQQAPPNGQQQPQNAPGSQATPQQPAQPQPQPPQQGYAGPGPGQVPGNGAVATGPQQPAPTPNGLAEPSRTTVEELERLIRNRYEPVENVANFFVAACKAPEPNAMRAALREHDGELGDLVAARLGNWIDESVQNVAYIQRLAEAVEIAGTAAGIYEPDDQEIDEPEVLEVQGQVQPIGPA